MGAVHGYSMQEDEDDKDSKDSKDNKDSDNKDKDADLGSNRLSTHFALSSAARDPTRRFMRQRTYQLGGVRQA
jgi:hypothetical protein